MARQFLNTLEDPIVQTKAGKLRGFLMDGIYTFHGIQYADADRFQPPHPVAPWDDVRNFCRILGVKKPSSHEFQAFLTTIP